MAGDVFDKYLSEINEAYLRGDATEHTHRPALKALSEALGWGPLEKSGIGYLKRGS